MNNLHRKEFPRIYSLSTIGLIHHGEFDYLFHPFRTDFIGESGTGKSMIADLIQLIFVGSEAFDSATRATDTREPEGMVLQTDKRGKGVGYALLNLEMAPAKFLVVGSYLETGNRNSQSFIIQAGFEWPKIDYLQGPLSYKQLLLDDDILAIDQLKDWVEQNNLHLKAWSKPKEYHKILFQQKILPLDLASSDKLLNDYAIILQSFSRGKTLDIQKQDSLKQFLFGSKDAKRMLEQFRKAEQDMAQAIGDYGNNLQEIDRVTYKQKSLLELRQLKAERDEYQNTWLQKQLLYAYQEKAIVEKAIKDLVSAYQGAIQHHGILKELLEKEQQENAESLPSIKEYLEEAEEVYIKNAPHFKEIEEIDELLRTLHCSFDELQHYYEAYHQDKKQMAVLSPFLSQLKSKNLHAVFASIPDKSSLSIIKGYLETQLQLCKATINQKELLKKYINLNDSESLANWALKQKRPFSLEEESAIISFQKLPRTKVAKVDYLPKPEELLLALPIAEKEKEGFWINLNGIRTYVPYVEQQLLDTTDEAQIRTYLNSYTSTLEKDISFLEKDLHELQFLQSLLNEHETPTLLLAAYRRKEDLLNFKINTTLDISPERFVEYQCAYKSREVIEHEYNMAREDKNRYGQQLKVAEIKQEQYTRLLKEMQITPLPEAAYLVLEEVGVTILPAHVEKQNLEAAFLKATDKYSYLRGAWEQIQPSLTAGHQIIGLNQQFNNAINETEKAQTQYLTWHSVLPFSLVSEAYIPEPKQDQQRYLEAETKYSTRYNAIIHQLIPSESYRLEGSNDFIELAKNLLPEAFYNVVAEASETGVIERIAFYLNEINEKNKQLNNRKIQKIKDLLDEVDTLTTQQENIIRRIDNFLGDGAQITGGYNARLQRHAAVNYPKSWMSRFRDTLEDEQQSGKLQSRLADKVQLEDMMKEAFISSGGPATAVPNISKLLDPASYYELSFAMKSDSGRINKGSTGQTYAAIALLCIARLSIMSNDEGQKTPPAVRIMPIDEAEGLGSNYDMLYDIASRYDYQLISLSISLVGKFKDGEQYLYMLHKNVDVDEPINYTPIPFLGNGSKKDLLAHE